MQPAVHDALEGGDEQDDVVAVGAIARPGEGHAGPVGGDRPFEPELGPVGGVLSGAFAACRCLVLAAVDEHLGQVELTDAVVGGDGLISQPFEDVRGDPLVTAAQRGLAGPDQPARVDPRAAECEADEDAGESGLVVDAGPVATQRMLVNRRGWQQPGDGSPHGVDHAWVKGAHLASSLP